MIRFVDLRPADIEGYRFAFWNTVNNRFVQYGEEQAWETWDDFVHCYPGEYIERFKQQTPAWVHEPPIPDKYSSW